MVYIRVLCIEHISYLPLLYHHRSFITLKMPYSPTIPHLLKPWQALIFLPFLYSLSFTRMSRSWTIQDRAFFTFLYYLSCRDVHLMFLHVLFVAWQCIRFNCWIVFLVLQFVYPLTCSVLVASNFGTNRGAQSANWLRGHGYNPALHLCFWESNLQVVFCLSWEQ